MRPVNVGEHMSRFPFVASRKTMVKEALNLMAECRIRHLPVIENNKVVGVVSERDLKVANSMNGKFQLLVEDVMSSDPYLVKKGSKLMRVTEDMARLKIGSAVVVDDRDQVLGIFTTTDALKLLSQLLKDTPELEYNNWGIERFMPSIVMQSQ